MAALRRVHLIKPLVRPTEHAGNFMLFGPLTDPNQTEPSDRRGHCDRDAGWLTDEGHTLYTAQTVPFALGKTNAWRRLITCPDYQALSGPGILPSCPVSLSALSHWAGGQPDAGPGAPEIDAPTSLETSGNAEFKPCAYPASATSQQLACTGPLPQSVCTAAEHSSLFGWLSL